MAFGFAEIIYIIFFVIINFYEKGSLSSVPSLFLPCSAYRQSEASRYPYTSSQ